MAGTLKRRADGSIALFINGDLQFDSNDERIYHEALALPALALASRRSPGELKALVIGGGDGLVAREIFKSARVVSLDLVDYDGDIVAFAGNEFAQINCASLSDSRIKIHVEDAWEFAHRSVRLNSSYDIIVSDLTVPEDMMEARFHSVEWYEALAQILAPQGILAVNAVSPQATPRAYWSIFNGMIKAGLHARPYHVSIPSFSALGYGEDWGFLIASAQPIESGELDQSLILDEPRHYLADNVDLRKLFLFPEELFKHQSTSQPAAVGSDILLRYFNNHADNESVATLTSGTMRDALSWQTGNLVIPESHTDTNILSSELVGALARSISNQLADGIDKHDSQVHDGQDAQAFLHEVLDLMPSLERQQTSALIAEFLQEPTIFLQSIDLPGLVARLLARAADLPAILVAELQLLQEKLAEWAGDHLTLISLGRHVVTMLTLVIVIGNLLYPDMVYAKGEHSAAASHSAANAGARGTAHGAHTGARGTGVHTSGWYNGAWRNWNGTNWVYDYTKRRKVLPGPNSLQSPQGSLRQPLNVTFHQSVDEEMAHYPARRYRIDSQFLEVATTASAASQLLNVGATASASSQIQNQTQTQELHAVFRLGPGTDILSSGHIAVPLTEQAYLIVTPVGTHVIDRLGGETLLSLKNDPALIGLTRSEVDRQMKSISEAIAEEKAADADTYDTYGISTVPAVPTNERMRSAVTCLQSAQQLLSDTKFDTAQVLGLPQKADAAPGSAGVPPASTFATLAGALPGYELFPSVRMTGDGKFIVMHRQSGEIAYLDRSGWYHDQGTTSIADAYPERFKSVTISYLSRLVRNADSKQEKLLADRNDLVGYMTVLQNELHSYEQKREDFVHFGTRNMPRAEAVKLSHIAINKVQRQIDSLSKQIEALPEQVKVAKVTLANLNGTRSA